MPLDPEILNGPTWLLVAIREDYRRLRYDSWVQQVTAELKKRGVE